LDRRRESKCWQAIIALLQALLLQPGGHYSVELAGLAVTVRGMHYAVAPNTPPNVIYRNRGINSLTKKCLGTFFGSGRVTCQLCSASYEFQLKCTFWDQRIVKIVLNTQYSSLSKNFSTLRLTTTDDKTVGNVMLYSSHSRRRAEMLYDLLIISFCDSNK